MPCPYHAMSLFCIGLLPQPTRPGSAPFVRRHSGTRCFLGIVEPGITRRFSRRRWTGLRLMRSPCAPLVGRLLLGLLVFDDALIRVGHRLAPLEMDNGRARLS